MKNNKGFTLIELMVVIMIIGILAGIVITVINPVAQQNKAKDAVIKSTMSKISVAIMAHYNAYNAYPTCAQLGDSLTSFTIKGDAKTATNCTITGNAASGTKNGKYEVTSGKLSYPSIGANGSFFYWVPGQADVTLGKTEAF